MVRFDSLAAIGPSVPSRPAASNDPEGGSVSLPSLPVNFSAIWLGVLLVQSSPRSAAIGFRLQAVDQFAGLPDAQILRVVDPEAFLQGGGEIQAEPMRDSPQRTHLAECGLATVGFGATVAIGGRGMTAAVAARWLRGPTIAAGDMAVATGLLPAQLFVDRLLGQSEDLSDASKNRSG